MTLQKNSNDRHEYTLHSLVIVRSNNGLFRYRLYTIYYYILVWLLYNHMKQTTFSKAKDNHFYAERINGELLQVKEPIIGKKYYEIAVISGGLFWLITSPFY